ncbi:MAG TPA: hypothetical protein VH914_12830 [Acidimicrobiia bacterium]|jgi:hypothetical protein|nr:hypothetical protein [Acidimicrobiia bacterium]
MGTRTPTALWLIDVGLVAALDGGLGIPVDSYVNGSQTWLSADGPNGVELEWRLHPVSAYRVPDGLTHYDVWDAVVDAVAAGADAGALPLGSETRALTTLWDGLECYAAYGDEMEPATLAAAAAEVLGRAPDAAGLVDHEAIGDAWEKTMGQVSIVELLLAQLKPTASQ